MSFKKMTYTTVVQAGRTGIGVKISPEVRSVQVLLTRTLSLEGSPFIVAATGVDVPGYV
jgi:hypothetical protein